MTEQEIAQQHAELARLGARIEEVTTAAKRNPMSRHIAFLERRLAQHWNKLVSELTAAKVPHEYNIRAILEDEKPVPLTWLQQLFVETGQTPADLMRKDEPKPSMFGDGLSDIIGY